FRVCEDRAGPDDVIGQDTHIINQGVVANVGVDDYGIVDAGGKLYAFFNIQQSRRKIAERALAEELNVIAMVRVESVRDAHVVPIRRPAPVSLQLTRQLLRNGLSSGLGGLDGLNGANQLGGFQYV